MAAELGYEALALTDHDGVSGSLEFAHAAKLFGIRAITGAELTLEGGAHVTLLVETARGYANLCRLLTAAHAGTRPDTGSREGFSTAYRAPIPPSLPLETLLEHTEGLVCLSGCARHGLAVRNPNAAARVAQAFGRESFFVELQRPYERGDARRNARLRELAEALGVRTVATGDVHAHHATRIALQDVLVAVRNNTSLEGCEPERRGNHEAVLRPPAEAAERFPDDRDAVARTAELAAAAPRSTSPRSSATATPTSPTATSRPTSSSPASATAPSTSATAGSTATSGVRASGSTRSLRSSARSASPASSCSTTRCSSSPATSPARCAARTRRAASCRPAAGAAARSARSSAT